MQSILDLAERVVIPCPGGVDVISRLGLENGDLTSNFGTLIGPSIVWDPLLIHSLLSLRSVSNYSRATLGMLHG